MEQFKFIAVTIGAAAMLVGISGIIWQLLKLVEIDADSRGLKHPKLWGIIATGGNNSSGLLYYFIVRKKHPVIKLSEPDKNKMEKYKKGAGVGLIFLAAGAIVCMLSLTFLF